MVISLTDRAAANELSQLLGQGVMTELEIIALTANLLKPTIEWVFYCLTKGGNTAILYLTMVNFTKTYMKENKDENL